MSTESSTPISIYKPLSFRWISRLVDSSIGGKYLVAVTGLLLTGFVVFHMLGNLQVFLGRDAFNHYAQSLKNLGPLLWVARGGLLTLFVVHVILALKLKKRGADARPIPYKYERTIQASIASRYMVLTGLTILFFVIFHIAHFTLGWVDRVRVVDMGETINYTDLKDPVWKDPLDTTKTRHDAYRMFIDGFRNVPIVALYIICQLLLGMHLIHGVNSSFQSLGLNSRKFNAILHGVGYGITAIVVAGNVFMPLAVLFRFIGTDIS